MELREQLVKACEKGDLKAVREVISMGASPTEASRNGGPLPIEAAVQGMSPEVVDFLISEMKGTPVTWDEIVRNNTKHYGRTFLVPAFPALKVENLAEWNAFLDRIAPSSYISELHRAIAANRTHDGAVTSISKWREDLTLYFERRIRSDRPDLYDHYARDLPEVIRGSEQRFDECRKEIAHAVTRAENDSLKKQIAELKKAAEKTNNENGTTVTVSPPSTAASIVTPSSPAALVAASIARGVLDSSSSSSRPANPPGPTPMPATRSAVKGDIKAESHDAQVAATVAGNAVTINPTVEVGVSKQRDDNRQVITDVHTTISPHIGPGAHAVFQIATPSPQPEPPKPESSGCCLIL